MNVNPCHVNMVEAVLMGFNSYTCECTTGYTGERCETNIDECESMPCDHGKSCMGRVNSYRCECTEGFTGERCETNINECTSDPFQNSGTCSRRG